MSSPQFKDTVCRICLDEGKLFDWKNTLKGHKHVTYKDCYYKYTQIEPLDTDPFSNMLCQNCLQRLHNVHEFILKALDSYNFLLEVNCANFKIDSSVIIEEILTYDSNEFETCLVERNHTVSAIKDKYEFENSAEDFFTINPTSEKTNDSDVEYTITKLTNNPTDSNNEKKESDVDQSLKVDNSNVRTFSKSITKNSIHDDENIAIERKIEPKKLRTEQSKANNKTRGRYNKREQNMDPHKIPCMCSICSRILHNKYALEKHEKTHIENRERKVPCPICGVKFFEQANMVTHMHIHDEKREKNHKCEFCGKAFYAKGVLNVHRRVHLGQMFHCTLCEKQFYRKIDLDVHMNSHSAIAINGVTRKRSRYLVKCQYCDKQILSSNYKSHAAAHLNQPLVKCLICDKEFFSRSSCKDHVKLKHDKKTNGEWNQFILSYDNKRLSHLLLAQTTEIIPTHK